MAVAVLIVEISASAFVILDWILSKESDQVCLLDTSRISDYCRSFCKLSIVKLWPSSDLLSLFCHMYTLCINTFTCMYIPIHKLY